MTAISSARRGKSRGAPFQKKGMMEQRLSEPIRIQGDTLGLRPRYDSGKESRRRGNEVIKKSAVIHRGGRFVFRRSVFS